MKRELHTQRIYVKILRYYVYGFLLLYIIQLFYYVV